MVGDSEVTRFGWCG